MDDNLPERVRALEDRVLQLEAGRRAPLSYADHIIAEELNKKRHEPHEEARARLESLRAAKAEAERIGDDKPIDDFWRKLKAGVLSDSIRS
jgi:hypothetical protein